MKKITKSFILGDHTCTLETGRIARHLPGSVLITLGETVLLVTVVGRKEAKNDASGFPLTVSYQEKSYAAGRIPGGYFKREGRPTEEETLISRLIDRAIRPLFPKNFKKDVQVTVALLSLDPDVPAEIPAIIATSAALSISGIPFNGPLGAVRVGYSDDGYVLNPSFKYMQESFLNLIVAGTEEALLMVEAEASEVSESIIMNAISFGHKQIQKISEKIKEFSQEIDSEEWLLQEQDEKEYIFINDRMLDSGLQNLGDIYKICDKNKRSSAIDTFKKNLLSKISQHLLTPQSQDVFEKIFQKTERHIMRSMILEYGTRIDGRSPSDIRSISVDTNLLPRVHGSCLFTRGHTQSLAACTLGGEKDAQIFDNLSGEYKDSFILHYNFPPYCVGEILNAGGPKRREIGHGRLAKKAIKPVLPCMEQFPYVVRVVSEITESNGSSSMASVCGASAALMDAGVPIKRPVAGIAMGLIKDQNKNVILLDISGEEDHIGDMDFKVAGTSEGITALQMDIKVSGISREVIESALQEAKNGRLYILDRMNAVIHSHRSTVSKYAPQMRIIKIDPEKIRDAIGKGGATIRELTESTSCRIDISDDGVVKISGSSAENTKKAAEAIRKVTTSIKIGDVYKGTVVKIMDFGGFVEIIPGKQGLLHISKLSKDKSVKINTLLKEKQSISVEILDIDKQGKIRLGVARN